MTPWLDEAALRKPVPAGLASRSVVEPASRRLRPKRATDATVRSQLTPREHDRAGYLLVWSHDEFGLDREP
jgi:hypothetical protein